MFKILDSNDRYKITKEIAPGLDQSAKNFYIESMINLCTTKINGRRKFKKSFLEHEDKGSGWQSGLFTKVENIIISFAQAHSINLDNVELILKEDNEVIYHLVNGPSQYKLKILSESYNDPEYQKLSLSGLRNFLENTNIHDISYSYAALFANIMLSSSEKVWDAMKIKEKHNNSSEKPKEIDYDKPMSEWYDTYDDYVNDFIKNVKSAEKNKNEEGQHTYYSNVFDLGKASDRKILMDLFHAKNDEDLNNSLLNECEEEYPEAGDFLLDGFPEVDGYVYVEYNGDHFFTILSGTDSNSIKENMVNNAAHKQFFEDLKDGAFD